MMHLCSHSDQPPAHLNGTTIHLMNRYKSGRNNGLAVTEITRNADWLYRDDIHWNHLPLPHVPFTDTNV